MAASLSSAPARMHAGSAGPVYEQREVADAILDVSSGSGNDRRRHVSVHQLQARDCNRGHASTKWRAVFRRNLDPERGLAIVLPPQGDAIGVGQLVGCKTDHDKIVSFRHQITQS